MYWYRPSRKLERLVAWLKVRPTGVRPEIRQVGQVLIGGLLLMLAIFVIAFVIKAGRESQGREEVVATESGFTLVVHPGWTAEQIAVALRQFGFSEADQFLAALCRPDNAADLPLAPRGSSCLEGYLLPGTYRVLHRMRADDVVRMMAQNFDRRLSYDLRNRAAELGLSIHDVVVLASIVEREVQNPPEQMLLGSVLLNRLEKGMPISDSPSRDRDKFSGSVTAAGVDAGRQEADGAPMVEALIGPHDRSRLPSRPLGNPSLLAIRNVLFAPKTGLFYHLRSYNGSLLFVETPQEYFDNLQQVEAAASWIKPYRKVDTRFDRSLAQDIQPLVNAFPGLAGIAIKNLSTGQAVFVNANESFEAGGLWRLLLMLAAMEEMERGRLEPDDVFEGRQGSVTDALESVLGDAGREAEAALAARVGLDRVQNLARSLGMTDTIIASGGMKTTPTDVLTLLEGMASQGTPEEALFREPFRSGLPEGLPPFTPVAHEAANLPQAIHDAGIVYTSRGAYAVVVMTERVPDEATASDFISAVSRLTYSHFALSVGDGPTGPYWDFNFQMSSANFSFAGAY